MSAAAGRPCPHLDPARRATCPSEADLAAFAHHGLSPERALALADVIASCVMCRSLLEDHMEDAEPSPVSAAEALGAAQAAALIELPRGGGDPWDALERVVDDAHQGYLTVADQRRSALVLVPVGTGKVSTPDAPIAPERLGRLVDARRGECRPDGLLAGARLPVAAARGAATARPFGLAVDAVTDAATTTWEARGAGLWLDAATQAALGPATRAALEGAAPHGWARLPPGGAPPKDAPLPPRLRAPGLSEQVVWRGEPTPPPPARSWTPRLVVGLLLLAALLAGALLLVGR